MTNQSGIANICRQIRTKWRLRRLVASIMPIANSGQSAMQVLAMGPIGRPQPCLSVRVSFSQQYQKSELCDGVFG